MVRIGSIAINHYSTVVFQRRWYLFIKSQQECAHSVSTAEINRAVIYKDRPGVLIGRVIPLPGFDMLRIQCKLCQYYILILLFARLVHIHNRPGQVQVIVVDEDVSDKGVVPDVPCIVPHQFTVMGVFQKKCIVITMEVAFIGLTANI